MAKTTSALETPLRWHLDRLAAFEPTDAPVLSLYLDLRPDQQGREQHDVFLRKILKERARTLKGAARKSFEQDTERILTYVATVRKSANGLAIFACSACNGFFEAVEMDAPIDQHWLFIGSVPHLYPLARVNDQYPRYAALIVDTNSARLFVFGLGAKRNERELQNLKTRRSSMGGWSQARYQRHLENFHLHHMKEVVEMLDRVVREEGITRIVVACDEVAKPTLMEQLPRHLADKVVDVMKLDRNISDQQVLADTLETLREKDSDTDSARVEAMLDAWRAGGLASAGVDDTLDALAKRQVEELFITTRPDRLDLPQSLPWDAAPGPVDVDTSAPATGIDSDRLKLADELVKRAQQQNARIRFIEDPELLADVGGVAALLRFKI